MSGTPDEIAHALREKSRDLGFERIGFAPAETPPRAEFFRRWLREGKAGTMTYLHRSAERRADPRLVLAGAKTIISVAQSYFTGWLPEEIRGDRSRGIIASYAGGQDYHDVLLAKLEQLAEFLRNLAPSANAVCYVDTGPVLERDHGERAGIGFVGKNSLLISPSIGSLFFLGEILTTVAFEPSPPTAMPSCGSCTRCLEICPTHAFPVPYVLDSTLCISYLTIEFKGVIPRELRPKMGNRIFGCDDCQSCCPWNLRFAVPTQEDAYRAALDRQAPLLSDLAELSEEAFHERFAGTAIRRAGYRGLMRNVAVALGNWGEAAARDGLERLAHHEDWRVRLHAAWGLGRVREQRAGELLRAMMAKDEHPEVREEARRSREADLK